MLKEESTSQIKKGVFLQALISEESLDPLFDDLLPF
jgi:hypothetical protein